VLGGCSDPVRASPQLATTSSVTVDTVLILRLS
jgi:hypothetical protein